MCGNLVVIVPYQRIDMQVVQYDFTRCAARVIDTIDDGYLRIRQIEAERLLVVQGGNEGIVRTLTRVISQNSV